jgi:DNA phosphorothioation-dependent restriction protein DptH
MKKVDTCEIETSIIDAIKEEELNDEQTYNEMDIIQDYNFISEINESFHNEKSEEITEIVQIKNDPELKVIFGKDSNNKEVIYYPKGKGNSPLPNYNIMVTGSSGKGKTQFIKSFIYQQGRKETSFTILDFKNDYSDNEFCDLCNLKKISVKLQGIPYNPLIPRLVKDEDTGEEYYDVSEHINGICSVLGSTFRLGDQQEAQLKRAVREVFKLSGLETKGTLKYKQGMSFPTFNEVGDYLDSGDKELEKLYNRLDPLFDLNLFPDKFKNVGFDNIINESYIIKVSDIQNDKIKNAIAKLIVISAHGFYLGSEHKSNVHKYFVFDEAHRILDSPFVEKFIRECRAFGVGVLLSSQQPGDFPEEVLGQLATKIIHGNEGIAKLTRKIKDLISFSQDDRYINNLQTFEAIINNQDYNNFIIKTLAWPHLMLLELVNQFPLGISFDELSIELIKRGVKGSGTINLLDTLVSKQYIKKELELYKSFN